MGAGGVRLNYPLAAASNSPTVVESNAAEGVLFPGL